MINKIPFMKKDADLIEYTFQSIMDYIEIWDDNLQTALANSIYIIYTNTRNENEVNAFYRIYSNMEKIVNSLLKFCMKIVSTEVNDVIKI
jgi:hypothetical protein